MATAHHDNCTGTLCQTRNFTLANNSLAIVNESKMPFEEIFKLAFEVLIALFGVIGNVLVIITIGKLGKRKQAGDFYLQNLATADLGTLLLTFPLAAIKEKAPLTWPLGKFTCRYLYPVPEIFFGASVWFIAVIAIKRYRELVTFRTPGIRRANKLQRATTIAAGVWVLSFIIFCLPLYFVVEYRELPNRGKWCGPVWPSWDRESIIPRVYIGLLTLSSYILPLIAISFTYLAIFCKLKQSSAFIKAMKREQRTITGGKNDCSVAVVKSIRLKQNKRAKKILTPLVLVFAVTMLPLNVLRLSIFWTAIAPQEYYTILLYIVSVFVIINSSANPFIYSIVSRDFRKGIHNLCLQQSRRNYLSAIVLQMRSRSRTRSRSNLRDSGHQLTIRT